MGLLISPPLFTSFQENSRQKVVQVLRDAEFGSGVLLGAPGQGARAPRLPRGSQPRESNPRDSLEMGKKSQNQDCDPDAGSLFNFCAFVFLAGIDVSLSRWVAALHEWIHDTLLEPCGYCLLH